MKAYVTTLGCPKNLVDSEATLTLLRRAGCELTDDPATADLLMVGACSFLDSSWCETKDEVRRLARYKDDGDGKRLVLMGCLPKHRDEDLETELPWVDHFLPTGAHGELPAMIDAWRAKTGEAGAAGGAGVARVITGEFDRFAGYENRDLLTPFHTAYVKVAEGCNRNCTFCAIPQIRGRQVTRPLASVIREVESMVQRGVKEVTLLAQDIVSYHSEGKKLAQLIDEISKTGIDWIRIFYVHPAGLSVEYLRRLFEHPAVCRYLEMPVQHASSRLLAQMKRSYDRQQIETLLGGARAAFPDIVIRSEVIVGFPGETHDDFDELMDFVREFEFDSLGIFPYSPEPGTVASEMTGAVGPAIIRNRVEELTAMQEAVSFGARSRFKDRSLRVLVDREVVTEEGVFDECRYAGRFYGQALEVDGEVYIDADALTVGTFADVTITDTGIFDLKAVI